MHSILIRGMAASLAALCGIAHGACPEHATTQMDIERILPSVCSSTMPHSRSSKR